MLHKDFDFFVLLFLFQIHEKNKQGEKKKFKKQISDKKNNLFSSAKLWKVGICYYEFMRQKAIPCHMGVINVVQKGK